MEPTDTENTAVEANAAAATRRLARTRAAAARLVEHPRFAQLVIAVISLNAVTLGLETWPAAMATAGLLITFLDGAALAFFVAEIALKLFAFGPRFFRSGWNNFDFIIVAVALMPVSDAVSALRALRVLRALRLVSVVPQMRAVVGALLTSLPGMGAIVAVLGLVFYIAAVMATKLFGETFPDWFGSVGGSMYTLFQVMTLESWSMGIVRPVMDEHPWAWIFFVPFIIVTSFAVLNLFIALIVNSMNAIHDAEHREDLEKIEKVAHDERLTMMAEIKAIRAELTLLRETLRQKE